MDIVIILMYVTIVETQCIYNGETLTVMLKFVAYSFHTSHRAFDC